MEYGECSLALVEERLETARRGCRLGGWLAGIVRVPDEHYGTLTALCRLVSLFDVLVATDVERA